MTPITRTYLEQISLRVRDHLLKQGVQSVSSTDSCMYRGIGGTMCAVGCLIADEHYNEAQMEGDNLNGLHVRRAVSASLGVEFIELSDDSMPLHVMLRAWQRFHDTNSTYNETQLSRMHTEIMLRFDDKLTFPNLPE